MANLAKNFPIFKGRKYEDTDLLVKGFEHYWNVANPTDVHLVVGALGRLKKNAFLNSFKRMGLKV